MDAPAHFISRNIFSVSAEVSARWDRPKKCAANAHIKNDARGRSQINIQNRGRGARARLQPLLDFSLFERQEGRKQLEKCNAQTRMDLSSRSNASHAGSSLTVTYGSAA